MIHANSPSMQYTQQLQQNQRAKVNASERLASGLRINRASDDAAGQAVSEKMRAQIRGMEQASRNTRDAVSFLQTAEGGMEEINEILQRTRELTIEASNGTKVAADRQVIQQEIDELKKELNDLVTKTEFNTMKPFSNTDPKDYVYEDRSTSKDTSTETSTTSRTVDTVENSTRTDGLPAMTERIDHTSEVNPRITNHRDRSLQEVGTTVADIEPRWSEDGEKIVFTSERDGGKYEVPADGSDPSVEHEPEDVKMVDQITKIDETLRLRENSIDNSLILEEYNDGWENVKSFDYAGGSFSFSSDSSADDASFVYSDQKGRIHRVDVEDREVVNEKMLISSEDDLNLNTDAQNNTLSLSEAPSLYRMNEGNASLEVKKVNGDGERSLEFWDGEGEAPDEGYIVNGREIEFFGDAIIGEEEADSAQDYYDISYVSSSDTDHDTYVRSLPANADVYNMDGSDGPRSLDIQIGGTSVERDELLAEKPSEPAEADGVYVDEDNDEIILYGDKRPAHHEDVNVHYRDDGAGNNEVYIYDGLPDDMNDYNFEEDSDEVRPLRIYVDGEEIEYDENKEEGFSFDPENGEVTLHGDARPDIPERESVRVEYVEEAISGATDEDVYGIHFDDFSNWRSDVPENYNLGEEDEDQPRSIRLYRNGDEEIEYDDTNGFQFNESDNRLELFGDARPNVSDTYEVEFIQAINSTTQDGVVEVDLAEEPETYDLDGDRSSIKVKVDGEEIEYDPKENDGFTYDSDTNRINIFGDSRPDSDEDIEVSYAYENPQVSLQDDTYDFRLSSDALVYGVDEDDSTPKSVAVTKDGEQLANDSEHGFTVDEGSGKVRLHGDARPKAGEEAGKYEVHTLKEQAIRTAVLEDKEVYKVEWNGEEVPSEGYVHENGEVRLVGDWRPDVEGELEDTKLEAFYHNSTDVPLDKTPMSMDLRVKCNEEELKHLFTEIDPDTIDVRLDGERLSSDQFALVGDTVELDDQSLGLDPEENHTIEVDYRVRHVTAYESNESTFHVGPSSGDSITATVRSFDNMLLETEQICVRNYDNAQQSLKVIDDAIDFTLTERSNIGAKVNRLDHIQANNDQTSENLTQAKSRIRDADMAKEMMEQTRADLLSQTTIAMQAQANQRADVVLQLLM